MFSQGPFLVVVITMGGIIPYLVVSSITLTILFFKSFWCLLVSESVTENLFLLGLKVSPVAFFI